MSTVELVADGVAKLPSEVQIQILEYVNFLTSKYEVEEDEELLKKFLLKREEEATNGNKRSWKEIKKDIYNKYYKQDV